MACSGAYCNNHGTGTTTCSNHRASCSTNRALTLSGEFNSGKVTAADIDAIRTAIRDEITRYDLHANYGPYTLLQGTAYNTSTQIGATQFNEMEQMVVYVGNAGSAIAVARDYRINAAEWTDLKNKYDTLRQDCICNSDCSCNLVCACHNDCACNYSDERLKENITFIETKNDLNIYSYTYVWDKTKTYIGVMAQELVGTKYSDALSHDTDGYYYMVDYNKLPI